MRRVIVTGSRTWTDPQAIEAVLRDLPHDVLIVHGAHWQGADAIADEIALRLGLAVERHPADWERYGRSAGPRRNEEMATAGAERCIAFRSPGRSAGTDDMIARARVHGIPVDLHT
jgi:hypothetical protein